MMRRDMIHFHSEGVIPPAQTLSAPWLLTQLSSTHPSPAQTVVQFLGRRIADDAPPDMDRAPPATYQRTAPRVGAWTQGLARHVYFFNTAALADSNTRLSSTL
jgi:hypothetical protein